MGCRLWGHTVGHSWGDFAAAAAAAAATGDRHPGCLPDLTIVTSQHGDAQGKAMPSIQVTLPSCQHVHNLAPNKPHSFTPGTCSFREELSLSRPQSDMAAPSSLAGPLGGRLHSNLHTKGNGEQRVADGFVFLNKVSRAFPFSHKGCTCPSLQKSWQPLSKYSRPFIGTSAECFSPKAQRRTINIKVSNPYYRGWQVYVNVVKLTGPVSFGFPVKWSIISNT